MTTAAFWGRWLAVLPAAVLGLFFVSFPIHWILLASFTREDAFLQLSPDGLATVERLAIAFFAPFAFIGVGAWTAPRHKFEAAIALAGVVLLVLGFVYGYALFAPQNRVAIDPIMVVLNLVGTTGAVARAWVTRHRALDNALLESQPKPNPTI